MWTRIKTRCWPELRHDYKCHGCYWDVSSCRLECEELTKDNATESRSLSRLARRLRTEWQVNHKQKCRRKSLVTNLWNINVLLWHVKIITCWQDWLWKTWICKMILCNFHYHYMQAVRYAGSRYLQAVDIFRQSRYAGSRHLQVLKICM